MEELDPIRAYLVVIFPIIPLYSPYIGLIYGRYLQLGTWNGHWIILLYAEYQVLVVPGPCRGKISKQKLAIRNQWLIGTLLRRGSNELLKLWGASTNEQMVVELPIKWHERIHAQLTDWMNQWTNKNDESMNPWNDASLNQRATEQWINEPMNGRRDGWWMNESMNEWVSEWMNACMHECMHGWMDEWATSLLSYFFTEVPPLSFLLLWPASALSCLAASSSAASATQFSSRSQHSAFSNL